MKPLTEKILRSGLVDKHTAEMMERYGILEEGASEKVNEDALKSATREQLVRLADELSEEVEKSNILRETALDLERLRWPVKISILNGTILTKDGLNAVIDRQGSYYFRAQDVKKEWFVPGYSIRREGVAKDEMLLESQELFLEETPVCIQVSTRASGGD